MITITLFVCLWICTAKDLKIAKYMNAAFIALVIVSMFVPLDLRVGLVLFALPAVYALFAPWKKYFGDRPRKWKKRWVQHPAEIVFYRLFVWMFRMMPLAVLSWIGGKVLETVGPRLTRRNDRARQNIAMICPENNNEKFIRKMWNNWGRVFVEGLKYDTYRRNVKKYITVKNPEMIHKYPQYIVVMPHTGNMGLMTLGFVHSGIRFGIAYKFPSNPMSNDILLGNYGQGNADNIYFIPVGNAITMMRALKNGDSMNINADQRVKVGEVLDFMGAPARTSTGVTELARRFDIPVLVAHVERASGARHLIIFDEFVKVPRTGDPRADEITGMQMVNDAMGRAIMRSPAEYLWMHRRWL